MSGPLSMKFINCRAIAFIMMVLRISLTPRRAFSQPGTKPQAAPARNPISSVVGMSSRPGQVAKVSANQVPPSAPKMIWPSAPMLMTLARNAMMMPRATRSRGVALTTD